MGRRRACGLANLLAGASSRVRPRGLVVHARLSGAAHAHTDALPRRFRIAGLPGRARLAGVPATFAVDVRVCLARHLVWNAHKPTRTRRCSGHLAYTSRGAPHVGEPVRIVCAADKAGRACQIADHLGWARCVVGAWDPVVDAQVAGAAGVALAYSARVGLAAVPKSRAPEVSAVVGGVIHAPLANGALKARRVVQQGRPPAGTPKGRGA